MKHKDFDFNGPSRLGQRTKRRKTNLILNSLIVIVLLLIIIVSFSIFFSNGDEASTTESKQTSQQDDTNEQESESLDEEDRSDSSPTGEESDDPSVPASTDTETSADTGTDATDSSSEVGQDTETENNVTEGNSSDSNVKTTITNPNWQPVGTVQAGEHVTVYDAASTDWQEMLQAISYGTGIDQGNMTVWFLGRNQQAPDGHSVATVSTKDNSITFIEWVNGQGWKPSKIEELHQNDKR
jgi:cytoskeletal protein RodZ